MKRNIKIFFSLLAFFMISLGINVNAVEVEMPSDFEVILPIHKTDDVGKPLEGINFTLKDFNNTISYSSSDKKEGDYLIQAYESEDVTLDKTINLLPSNYKEMITGINSWNDVQNLQNRDDVVFIHDDYYGITTVIFVVPFLVEESNVPDGYQKQDFVVTALVEFDFEQLPSQRREDIETRSDYYDNFFYKGFYIQSHLSLYEMPGLVTGYFEYDSSVDYSALYKKMNKKLNAYFNETSINGVSSQEEFFDGVFKIFEDEGYNTKSVECPDIPRPSIEKNMGIEDIQYALLLNPNPMCNRYDDINYFRFDESISNCYCILQVKNKKKNITINPATASTIGIISLIVLGCVGFITSKKLRNNN